MSARRPQRAPTGEQRTRGSPSRGDEGGQREAGHERPGGARSRQAWPASGAAGGAPRAGPQSRAGCPMRSCRPCRDPVMAVSTPGARGFRRPWGALSPGTALEKPREPGARRGGSWRAAAVSLAKLRAEVAEGSKQPPAVLPTDSCSSASNPSPSPGKPAWGARVALGCALDQARLGVEGDQVRSPRSSGPLPPGAGGWRKGPDRADSKGKFVCCGYRWAPQVLCPRTPPVAKAALLDGQASPCLLPRNAPEQQEPVCTPLT